MKYSVTPVGCIILLLLWLRVSSFRGLIRASDTFRLMIDIGGYQCWAIFKHHVIGVQKLFLQLYTSSCFKNVTIIIITHTDTWYYGFFFLTMKSMFFIWATKWIEKFFFCSARHQLITQSFISFWWMRYAALNYVLILFQNLHSNWLSG